MPRKFLPLINRFFHNPRSRLWVSSGLISWAIFWGGTVGNPLSAQDVSRHPSALPATNSSVSYGESVQNQTPTGMKRTEAKDQFVLTRQGVVQEGVLQDRNNAIYVQLRSGGGITISKLDIALIANTREEIFQFRRQNVRLDDIAEVIKLADWANRNQLTRQGKTLLENALPYATDHVSQKLLSEKISQFDYVLQAEQRLAQKKRNFSADSKKIPGTADLTQQADLAAISQAAHSSQNTVPQFDGQKAAEEQRAAANVLLENAQRRNSTVDMSLFAVDLTNPSLSKPQGVENFSNESDSSLGKETSSEIGIETAMSPNFRQPPADPLADPNWEAWSKTVPTSVQDRYIRRIQPILMRRCFQCHNETSATSYGLEKPTFEAPQNAVATGGPPKTIRQKNLQNLRQTMAWINLSQPQASPLLAHPPIQTGQEAVYPFGADRNSAKDYQIFVEWVQQLPEKLKNYTPDPMPPLASQRLNTIDLVSHGEVLGKCPPLKNADYINCDTEETRSSAGANDPPLQIGWTDETASLHESDVNGVDKVLQRGNLLPQNGAKDVYDPWLYNQRYYPQRLGSPQQ